MWFLPCGCWQQEADQGTDAARSRFEVRGSRLRFAAACSLMRLLAVVDVADDATVGLAAILELQRDHQLPVLRVHRVGLDDLACAAGDFAHQVSVLPPRLALETGRLVLDLLAVGGEARRPSVAGGDDDQRVGAGDRQAIGRRQHVAHRLHPPAYLLRVAVAEAGGATAAAAPGAASHAAPAPVAAATTATVAAAAARLVAAVLPIAGWVAAFSVQRPRADDRRVVGGHLPVGGGRRGGAEHDGDAGRIPQSHWRSSSSMITIVTAEVWQEFAVFAKRVR